MTKRRHNTGFGYIGSGNSTSVFNRKPRKAFSEIKDKLNYESNKKKQLNFNNRLLTEEDRISIKNNIRKSEKTKTIKSIIISLILLILLIIVAIYMIEGVLFRH